MNAGTHGELASFIWSICNLLRGPYKRNEYRKVILPLTVLRRFDCVLAETKGAVLAENERYNGEASSQLLQAASGFRFYNVSELDFERLLDDPNLIASNLTGYINRFSANVREIFERFGFEAQIAKMDEKNLLFQVVQAFAKVDLSPERVDNVQMGYVFEELIRIGAEQANEEAGEHFTPREVIRLMVSLLLSHEPDLAKSHVVKTIYDPACGTGGMLSVSEDFLREHNSTANPFLFGQDHNDDSWAVCASDMLIKGENAENIVLGDTFTADGYERRPDGRRYTFDYMLANPPFGLSGSNSSARLGRSETCWGMTGVSARGCRGSMTERCFSCSTCCRRFSRSKRAAAGLRSSSTGHRCLPATRGVGRARSGGGSSRTTGWKPSWRCRTNSSTTPGSRPTSGC